MTHARAIAVLGLALVTGCAKTTSPVAVGSGLPDRAGAVTTVDPVEVLAEFAVHPQPGVRSEAVRWQVWAGLSEPEGDASPWVQRAWVEGLALRGGPRAEARLVDLAGRTDLDPWVRCLAALVHPVGEMSVALEDYRAEPLAWRRLPLALGAWASGDAAAREAVATALSTGVLDWNLDLLLAIGHRGAPSLLPALDAADQVAEPELRLPLAMARLALLGDDASTEAMAPFRRALSSDDPEVRLEVVDLLMGIETAASTQLLVDAAKAGPELVTWYAELLLVDRGETRPSTFGQAFASANPEVRELAVRLGRPGASRPIYLAPPTASAKRWERLYQYLEQGPYDPDPRVRRTSYDVLARVGTIDMTAEAAQLLIMDADPRVRIAAAGYLAVRSAADD